MPRLSPALASRRAFALLGTMLAAAGCRAALAQGQPRGDPSLAPPVGIEQPTRPRAAEPPAAPPTRPPSPPLPPATPGTLQTPSSPPVPSIYEAPRTGAGVAPDPLPPLWGAIAFTASGHFWRIARQPTREQAEKVVLDQCKRARAGECKVSLFSRVQCAGLAVWQGSHSGKRFVVAVTRGGETTAEATANALRDCRTQPNVRGPCWTRTVLCGDGR